MARSHVLLERQKVIALSIRIPLGFDEQFGIDHRARAYVVSWTSGGQAVEVRSLFAGGRTKRAVSTSARQALRALLDSYGDLERYLPLRPPRSDAPRAGLLVDVVTRRSYVVLTEWFWNDGRPRLGSIYGPLQFEFESPPKPPRPVRHHPEPATPSAAGREPAPSHPKSPGRLGRSKSVMAQTDRTPQDPVKQKLTQVFRYLEALNQVRNPVQREIERQPWTLWVHAIPEHEAVEWGHHTASGEDALPSFLLRVRRPELTRPPAPPRELAEWLNPGWDAPTGKVTVKATITRYDEQQNPTEIAFDADPGRPLLLAQWRVRWEAWAERERPARQAMAVFERLYDLQARLERESERVELVLGEGLLTWDRPTGERIHHPILIQRLRLEFDPDVPAFTLRETEHPIELYSALFRSLPDVSPTAIGRIRDELDRDQWPLLGDEETSSFLRRVVSQLHVHGRFSEEPSERTEGDGPVITRSPVLFLRPRTLGFAVALEAILEDLKSRDQIPPALSKIVGIEPVADQKESAEEAPADAFNGEDEAVLLTKPANPEQLEIARRLARHGAVLVQGPPGTGKTHTIANLLGHLLAEGKTVLVTSHTAKALKVLKSQVVEPLQGLCVSAVADGSADLEATVDAITERLSSYNSATLEREAGRLTQERAALLRELRRAREQLRLARADEYRPIVVAGEEHDPSRGARLVAERRGRDAWIPGPVRLGEPLPLSVSEVHDLYQTNAALTPADERELAGMLPDPADLPPPSQFNQMVTDLRKLAGQDLGYRRDLWEGAPKEQTPDELTDLHRRLTEAVEVLSEQDGWLLSIIAAGRQGKGFREAWVELLLEIEKVAKMAAEAHLTVARLGPELPAEMPVKDAMVVIDSILNYLGSGKRLGALTLLLNREWKRFIEAARVNGEPPRTREDFVALRTLAEVAAAREKLVARWERQVTRLGGPDAATFGDEPEAVCQQYSPIIRRCLDWQQRTWAPLESELNRQGLRWAVLLAETPVNPAPNGDLLRLRRAVTESLPSVMAAQVARLTHRTLRRQVGELAHHLERLSGERSAEVVQALHQAVRERDTDGYARAFQRLCELHERREARERRKELLVKLEGAAPAWAAAIRNRQGIHGGSEVPGDPKEAWLWRQLHDELERRARVSLDALQGRIAQLTADLHRVTASLAEKKAWAAQLKRTTLKQRLALNGYKQLMKKVGRRTGKRVPEYLAEARRLMPVCQTAVPVWIMPLSRVVESFDVRRNRFDVIVIDEASQADILALTALYMGKQAVVVGDDEQVSPIPIGVNTDDVTGLMKEHLKGIPNARLYDGLCSIYDLAAAAFEPICLREHFRCVAPIIEFSNRLSYDRKIRPLRDDSRVARRPFTVAYRVEGGTADRKVNEREAVTLASLLVAATEQPEYDEATFGVISLLGSEQALCIDRLLQRYLNPRVYRERRVLCGNAAEFQGDERDVVFLSLVDSGREGGPLSLRREGAGNVYKKRYNVAASRARDQLWVVHSLDIERDLQPGDIRLRLIRHALDPLATLREAMAGAEQTESEFERQVLERLVSAGYRVKPQWRVGAYRIDMVVEGDGKRLAVECDGDRWHPIEKLGEDMARQAVLERLGWRFVRIRGSQYFRDPEGAMEPVFRRLQELGIPPVGPDETAATREETATELLERIVRRAAALRAEWAEDESEPVAEQPVRSDALPGSEKGRVRQIRLGELALTAPEMPCRLGAFFVVRDPSGAEFEYELVGPGRGDPEQGRISIDSPLGRAVVGKRAGVRVDVFAPDGKAAYELLDVRDPAAE